MGNVLGLYAQEEEEGGRSGVVTALPSNSHLSSLGGPGATATYLQEWEGGKVRQQPHVRWSLYCSRYTQGSASVKWEEQAYASAGRKEEEGGSSVGI